MLPIPKFLVERLYVKGSLVWVPDDQLVVFQVRSGLVSGHLTGVERICLGEVCAGPEGVTLVLGDEVRSGHGLTEGSPLWIPPQVVVEVRLAGLGGVALGARHEVGLSLVSRELGQFRVVVSDVLKGA